MLKMFVLLLISASTFYAAQTSVTSDLSALSWMTGHWTGLDGKVEMEEFWLSPKGNSMLGLHRDVANGKTMMFEFLRIDATPEGITYWASPRGRAPATPFRLKELRENYVAFENLQHDFPQRIIYWMEKDGSLRAKVEGTMNGKAASEEWSWTKAKN
jgi:Domain of unknown function (DUF6265)